MTIERREGHFTSHSQSRPHDGESELFYQTWTATDRTPRGTLVLTHGIGEHSESYTETAKALVGLGWDLIAWDLRGHGKSEGKRGHVDDFADFSHDLAMFLHYLKKTDHLREPFALIGHSMGGLVTLKYLTGPEVESNPKPSAVILSSPLLDVALEVPPVKDAAAKIAFKIWPSLTLSNEIRYEDLTRDPEWLKTYPRDTLRHDKISPALYFGMFDAMKDVREGAAKIRVPILIQASGQDRIVSLPATRKLFEKIGSSQKEIIVYKDSFHEIFNDLDREKVFADLDGFLGKTLGV